MTPASIWCLWWILCSYLWRGKHFFSPHAAKKIISPLFFFFDYSSEYLNGWLFNFENNACRLLAGFVCMKSKLYLMWQVGFIGMARRVAETSEKENGIRSHENSFFTRQNWIIVYRLSRFMAFLYVHSKQRDLSILRGRECDVFWVRSRLCFHVFLMKWKDLKAAGRGIKTPYAKIEITEKAMALLRLEM